MYGHCYHISLVLSNSSKEGRYEFVVDGFGEGFEEGVDVDHCTQEVIELCAVLPG